VGGSIVNVVGLLLMAFLPNALVHSGSGTLFSPSLLVLMALLMVVQFANNAAAAPFHALLPDLVPAEQRGMASGVMGLAFWLGTISGALVPTLLGINSDALRRGAQSYADYQHGVVLAYVITAAIVGGMALLTALFVHETPWQPSAASVERRSEARTTSRTLLVTIVAVLAVVLVAFALFRANIGLSFDDNSLRVLELAALLVAGYGAVRAFDFRPRRSPDFTWVVVTRMLVMMGVYIVQVFLLQYMIFVAKAPNPQAATTQFIILLTVAATASTLFAGWGSDRIGRKRMVYICGAFMTIVGAAFIFTPYFAPNNILQVAFIAAAIFGLGYGAYISVDWALVADVLPSEATFARDMGIWNIALTLPQVLAFVFGSILISLGVALGSRILGYTLLFVCFVVFCVLGTVTIRFIKGVR
jgi:MFS family permease